MSQKEAKILALLEALKRNRKVYTDLRVALQRELKGAYDAGTTIKVGGKPHKAVWTIEDGYDLEPTEP